MSGLARGFHGDRAALIVYLMGGYPDRETSLAAMRAAAASGADIIELGVPYGDPLADGPVIASAGHAARAQPGGFGLAEALDLAGEFTGDAHAPPLALMTYVNPLLRMGLREAARRASGAGVAGVIVPDLPPDGPVGEEWREAMAGQGLDTVFLAAPTSTDERLDTIAAASSGFVYCVAATGVTGERVGVSQEAAPLVRRVRERTRLPVAIGFGVGSPAQAAALAREADGVIVGSAVVRRQADPGGVGRFVEELARAVSDSVG